MSTSAYRVVIPSRYASSRLPAKALCDLGGKPLVVRVWENARSSKATEVVIATDDDRIREVAEANGAAVVMTSPDHATGTDRLAEVAESLGWEDEALVVNLQGDEPLVPPSTLDALAAALRANPSAGIATMATPITDSHDLFRPDVVKVVLDDRGFALYFSRAPIPWVRGAFAWGETPSRLPPDPAFLRHIGLYGYRVGTLRQLASRPQGELERAESLEQLRALGAGIAIHVTMVQDAPAHGVDTEEDLARVRMAFARR